MFVQGFGAYFHNIRTVPDHSTSVACITDPETNSETYAISTEQSPILASTNGTFTTPKATHKYKRRHTIAELTTPDGKKNYKVIELISNEDSTPIEDLSLLSLINSVSSASMPETTLDIETTVSVSQVDKRKKNKKYKRPDNKQVHGGISAKQNFIRHLTTLQASDSQPHNAEKWKRKIEHYSSKNTPCEYTHLFSRHLGDHLKDQHGEPINPDAPESCPPMPAAFNTLTMHAERTVDLILNNSFSHLNPNQPAVSIRQQGTRLGKTGPIKNLTTTIKDLRTKNTAIFKIRNALAQWKKPSGRAFKNSLRLISEIQKQKKLQIISQMPMENKPTA